MEAKWNDSKEAEGRTHESYMHGSNGLSTATVPVTLTAYNYLGGTYSVPVDQLWPL